MVETTVSVVEGSSSAVDLLSEALGCFGDGIWNYVSPFAGGYANPEAYTLYVKAEATAASNGVTNPYSQQDIYNEIMITIKSAFFTAIGAGSSSAASYTNSTSLAY